MAISLKPRILSIDELFEYIDFDGLLQSDIVNLVESLTDDGSMSLRAVLKKELAPLTNKQTGSAYLEYGRRFFTLQFHEMRNVLQIAHLII
jgi:hypothetical protein